MKNYILLLAGLLICLASPPGAYAAPPVRDLPVVYEYKASVTPVVPEALAVVAATSQCSPAVLLPTSCASEVAVISAETSGATVQEYLSASATALRERPSWHRLNVQGFTRYKAPWIRLK